MTETQALIVGAGPVGLTLALDLGQRGVYCVLIEDGALQRTDDGDLPPPGDRRKSS
jgi:2-polyprenyl-6-methoxyphenol hydroxylase-like FAD-dependent oxidoreductase